MVDDCREIIMKDLRKRIICVLLALLMTLSVFIMAACTPDKAESGSDEEGLRAADPMTEEEIENDDTDGCIEDAEDLLN